MVLGGKLEIVCHADWVKYFLEIITYRNKVGQDFNQGSPLVSGFPISEHGLKSRQHRIQIIFKRNSGVFESCVPRTFMAFMVILARQDGGGIKGKLATCNKQTSQSGNPRLKNCQ